MLSRQSADFFNGIGAERTSVAGRLPFAAYTIIIAIQMASVSWIPTAHRRGPRGTRCCTVGKCALRLRREGLRSVAAVGARTGSPMAVITTILAVVVTPFGVQAAGMGDGGRSSYERAGD